MDMARKFTYSVEKSLGNLFKFNLGKQSTSKKKKKQINPDENYSSLPGLSSPLVTSPHNSESELKGWPMVGWESSVRSAAKLQLKVAVGIRRAFWVSWLTGGNEAYLLVSDRSNVLTSTVGVHT